MAVFSAKPILPYAPIRKADAFTVIRSVFRAALYILPRTPDHTIRSDSFHREPLWRYGWTDCPFSLRQCLTLAEIIITLPSCKLTAALPSSRYQPLPAVQSQSCPPPFEAQLVCRLFKGHIGGKKNTASRDGEAVQTGFPWTSRCRFSSLRTRLAVWYPPSVRRCWFWIRSCHRHTFGLLPKQL